jgi:hypothetical protein
MKDASAAVREIPADLGSNPIAATLRSRSPAQVTVKVVQNSAVKLNIMNTLRPKFPAVRNIEIPFWTKSFALNSFGLFFS